MRNVLRNTLVLVTLGLGASLGARDAAACGGTFCDGGGPMQMSVDQKGENILFVSDGTSIEAHIQIQYDGKNASRFAWIIPVQSEPTSIGVGSQALFANLLAGTVPSYGFSTVNDCQPPFCAASSGTGAGGSGASTGGGPGSAGAGGSGDGGPVVTQKGTAGAFDYVVLKGGTGATLMQWLSDNGFQQIPAAKAIFDDYLASGHVFVAVRLTGGAGVDEIHPLVVKYVGQQPCVPLKLTAVAAVENMGVRAFFLGQSRWVPTNYKHMVLNDARIDWTTFAKNYADVVANAADAPVNDGHAFVTEYAGSSAVVGMNGIYSPAWDPTPFPTLAIVKVVNELSKQGLMSCQVGVQCSYAHPLIEGLLHEFLPPPTGLSDASFYGCLGCYQNQIDPKKWDGMKFAQAFIARVIAPGARAEQILGENPYVTRLFTTISPAEMTVDPEFHERTDLLPVNDKALATRHLACAGRTGMDLPDGREIALAGTSWPTWDASMPWVARIEEIPLTGAPVVLVDNTGAIDDAVTAWNASQSWPPPPPPPPAPCNGGGFPGTGGGGGKGTSPVGGGGVTGNGPGGASSPTTGAGGAASADSASAEPSGGCSVVGAAGSSGLGAGFVGLLAALARRRRARVGRA